MEFFVLGWAKHYWRSSEYELKLPSPFMERGFQGDKTSKLKISQGQYMMVFLNFFLNEGLLHLLKEPMQGPASTLLTTAFTYKELLGHT